MNLIDTIVEIETAGLKAPKNEFKCIYNFKQHKTKQPGRRLAKQRRLDFW